MTKNVIFLDYDGVLNSPFYQIKAREEAKQIPELYKRNPFLYDFDPIRIALLNYAVSETGAKVVPISSWRNNKDAIKYLKRTGLPIIGVTPTLPNKDRNAEILQWIEDKKFEGDYIILDDEGGYDKDLSNHLIYTRETYNPNDIMTKDYVLGLQSKHIRFIIGYLGRKNEKITYIR